jgi:hypothetical protein
MARMPGSTAALSGVSTLAHWIFTARPRFILVQACRRTAEGDSAGEGLGRSLSGFFAGRMARPAKNPHGLRVVFAQVAGLAAP